MTASDAEVFDFEQWKWVGWQVVGEAGIEPTTPGLEGRCSIQLSYSPALILYCSVASAQNAPVKAAREAPRVRAASAGDAPQAVR